MGDSLAVDPRKLEWSGKLCALLLNDGTNALRWFLKENLPRNKEKESDLDQVSDYGVLNCLIRWHPRFCFLSFNSRCLLLT